MFLLKKKKKKKPFPKKKLLISQPWSTAKSTPARRGYKYRFHKSR